MIAKTQCSSGRDGILDYCSRIMATTSIDSAERGVTSRLLEKSPLIVNIDNVHKTYLIGVEGVAALRGVTASVKRGEFVMICGTSGGGKTSLLNIIGTIDKPTKGRLSLCGTHVTPRTSDDELAQIRLEKMGFVFQTFNLLSTMTAIENVELPLILQGVPMAERKRVATELLKKMQMGERLGHFPNMLSGGEQQRVTIARAMANRPELLLLDEPTGDLDTVNTEIVMRLLLDLNRKDGITLLMVTHDMNLTSFADRVLHMRDGKLVRIEEVSAERRQTAIDNLNAALTGHSPFVLVRDGAAMAATTVNPVRTFVRFPSDYKPHAFAHPDDTIRGGPLTEPLPDITSYLTQHLPALAPSSATMGEVRLYRPSSRPSPDGLPGHGHRAHAHAPMDRLSGPQQRELAQMMGYTGSTTLTPLVPPAPFSPVPITQKESRGELPAPASPQPHSPLDAALDALGQHTPPPPPPPAPATEPPTPASTSSMPLVGSQARIGFPPLGASIDAPYVQLPPPLMPAVSSSVTLHRDESVATVPRLNVSDHVPPYDSPEEVFDGNVQTLSDGREVFIRLGYSLLDVALASVGHGYHSALPCASDLERLQASFRQALYNAATRRNGKLRPLGVRALEAELTRDDLTRINDLIGKMAAARMLRAKYKAPYKSTKIPDVKEKRPFPALLLPFLALPPPPNKAFLENLDCLLMEASDAGVIRLLPDSARVGNPGWKPPATLLPIPSVYQPPDRPSLGLPPAASAPQLPTEGGHEDNAVSSEEESDGHILDGDPMSPTSPPGSPMTGVLPLDSPTPRPLSAPPPPDEEARSPLDWPSDDPFLLSASTDAPSPPFSSLALDGFLEGGPLDLSELSPDRFQTAVGPPAAFSPRRLNGLRA
ncbi:putative ABC transporter H family member 2 [Paratrimastix pyriformis]|uniref:ABC transporter H family member 2 n=1 Tax=Paratrimastix pyriformis TaxID=342808 RepID=A0ABQ8UHH4_9EUKA|nr:putative ABC transporter H family member 2 [Paratrimastix pyriformis]